MNIRYQVQVYNRAGTAVEFTLYAELGTIPVVGGQVVRPTQGRTESRPWTIDVVDAANVITSRLGDPATGRAWLLGRLVRVHRSLDGGDWQMIDTGRLTNVYEGDGPGLYTLQVYDERWVERQGEAFTEEQTAIQLYPAGLRGRFRGNPAVTSWVGRWQRTLILPPAITVVYHCIKLEPRGPISQEAIDFMRSRLEHRVGETPQAPLTLYTESLGADHGSGMVYGGPFPIVAISSKQPSRWTPYDDPAEGLHGFDPRTDRFAPYVWVVGGTAREGFHAAHINAPPSAPTETLPHHIGLREDYITGPSAGIDPFVLVEQLYQQNGVRYAPHALDALKGRYPHVAFRPTRVERLADWLEDHIYGPLLVVPFVDVEGRVAPRSVAMPIMTQEEYDDLFEFNASNLSEPYPTWEHTSRDMVNVLNIETVDYIYVSDEDAKNETHYGLDRLKVVDDIVTYEHDILDYVPRSELTIQAHGFWGPDRDEVLGVLKREIFDRFGDGPIRGRMFGMLSTNEVEPGDFVKLGLDDLPNPALNARGGERVVQILSRITHPDGYEFEFLDAGAALQPVPAPGVAIAQNEANPRHAVDVTISVSAPGAKALLQLALDADFTRIIRAMADRGEGTHTIAGLPSGTMIYVRAVATLPERIRGTWSAVQSVATMAIPAPSGLVVMGITRHQARLAWTVGSMDHGVEVLLHEDSTPPAQWTDEHLVVALEPGAAEYRLASLNGPDVDYVVAVRHLDLYGGHSAAATTSFTTLATTVTAPRPAGIALVGGGVAP